MGLFSEKRNKDSPEQAQRKADARKRKKSRDRARRVAGLELDRRYRPLIEAMAERDRGRSVPAGPQASPVKVDRGDEQIVVPAYSAAELAAITKDRVPLSTQERTAILRRDRYRCRYCSTRKGPFHIDHVLPVILGGTNDPDNLVAACKPCNLKKGMQIWTPLDRP